MPIAHCTPKCIKSDTPLQTKDNRVPFDFVAKIASRGDNDAIEIMTHTGQGVQVRALKFNYKTKLVNLANIEGPQCEYY